MAKGIYSFTFGDMQVVKNCIIFSEYMHNYNEIHVQLTVWRV